MEELTLRGKTVLVVDDEADLREIIASELDFMGAKVFQAENVSGAKSILDDRPIDLIISDIRMPGGTGIDLLNHVKKKKRQELPVILITGFADITAEKAFDQGAEALLNKPFRLEDLIQKSTSLITSPENRYKIQDKDLLPADIRCQFSEALKNKIHNHECAIGRGGMALTVNSSRCKWEAGNEMSFNFKFKDVELSGSAICRWWKVSNSTSKATLGLEFIHLSDDTLKYLSNYWHKHNIISFIPSLVDRSA